MICKALKNEISVSLSERSSLKDWRCHYTNMLCCEEPSVLSL